MTFIFDFFNSINLVMKFLFFFFQEGVNSLTADTIAGVAECTFERPARVTKTFETGDIAFDLAISEYHIIMAKGSINSK